MEDPGNEKNKLFVIAALVLLTAFCFVSCAEPAPATSVKLVIKSGSEQLFGGTVTLDIENPTVIDVVNKAAADNHETVNIVVSESGDSLESVNEYKVSEIDGLHYYWLYTIDGVEPTEGMANDNSVANGNTVEYRFVSYDPDTQQTKDYDAESGHFSVSEAEDTAEETEDE